MSTLLERASDLAELRSALEAAARGQGRVVLVAGDAGIGKSSLVDAFATDPGSDAQFLTGWCDDLLTSRTYGPLRDVARRVGGELADAVAAADTSAVTEAVLRLLEHPLRPTVLTLEDLHWADEATLDIVRLVGRRIEDRPAVLVLTYRDSDLGNDHPLRSVLGALPPRAVHRIRPRPLSRSAIGELIAGTGLDVDEVSLLTDGNPFYVTEVAAGETLPASVTDAVLARLQGLSPSTQEAVGMLSVIPRSAAHEVVGAIVPDPRDLAEAEVRGLLVTDAHGVRFRHELARRAVLRSLPVTTRVAYHTRVLEVLLEDDVEPTDLVHHAVEAGRAEVVARYGPMAVRGAYEARANREALAHAERTLRYHHLLEEHVEATVLEQQAWALYNLGRFPPAKAAAERAVEIRQRLPDRAAHAGAALTAARMAYMTNEPERCRELMDLAGELMDATGSAAIAPEDRVTRVALLHLVERHAESVAEADEAERIAEAAGRGDLLPLIAVYRGGSRAALDDEGGLDEMLAVAGLEPTPGNIQAIARCYANLTDWLVGFRRWDEAERNIDAALEFYDDHDFAAGRFNAVAGLAWMQLMRGRWAEADATLQLLRPIQRVGESGVLETTPLSARALLDVRSGADGAEASLRAAWDVAIRSGAAWCVVPVASAGIEHAWASGQPDRADPYVVVGLDAAGDSAWRDWILWRMAVLLDREVDPTEMTIAAERSGVADGWEAGAASFERLGMPYERALELIRSGRVEPTLEGLSVLAELGAEPAARIARQRVRDLGVTSVPRGPQRSTRANPATLTDRQLEVLDLLAAGLTNAEIAERLVVSVRTVDHHVSAVLQKLGVTSRQEAAEVAATLSGT